MNLSDRAFWSRFQFGFTLIYHYLFPQLTMGLSWFLVFGFRCTSSSALQAFRRECR
jgi:cytochrome bd-type quinol oxidase subunit 1